MLVKSRALIAKMEVSDKTKQQYNYRLNRIAEIGIAIYGPEESIMETICEIPEITYNIFHDFLSVIYVLRRDNGNTNIIIDKYKTDEDYYEKNCKFKKEVVEKETPKVEEILKHVDSLYKNQNWESYIINYLIVKYNTRNMDLDLVVTKEEDMNPFENYICLKDDTATFVRNNYKTIDSYGPKRHEITDEKFVNACRKYLDPEDKKYLLTTLIGYHIKESSLSSFIRCRTYQKLGQGAIFSILATHATKYKLKNMAKNRGTSMETVMDYYDKGGE